MDRKPKTENRKLKWITRFFIPLTIFLSQIGTRFGRVREKQVLEPTICARTGGDLPTKHRELRLLSSENNQTLSRGGNSNEETFVCSRPDGRGCIGPGRD